MANNTLVKYGQKSLLKSSSTSGAAGKSLVAVGGTGVSLWFIAGLIPFVTLPMIFVALIVAGFFMWE